VLRFTPHLPGRPTPRTAPTGEHWSDSAANGGAGLDWGPVLVTEQQENTWRHHTGPKNGL
ncbi:Hypothetical predicted protein, partial [Pelobates cultripes]